ncbi:MAG: DNA polymerase III subunit delta [Pseudoflavonifractor sp.]|nr:DNA polymerase III subunit delta [Alloprevotella sp.]MCM1117667.1 DNA polymerase III subunit delta [Pseudoflavonifractor sp.]
MANPSAITYASLRASLVKGQVNAPVFILHGEEGYFTDELVKLFEALVSEADRDFGLFTFYGPTTNAAAIIQAARSFPMMVERQVVIVKEAQAMNANEINKLAPYVAAPAATTIFVLCYRGAQAKGKDLLAAAKKGGAVVLESKKLNERNIGPVIESIVKEKGINIEPRSVAMLSEYIGTDASRLYNEIDKLALVLGKGSTITPEAIERNIGISKDYNNFELVSAVATRDMARMFTILGYFRANPKGNPTVLTTAALFNFFSGLLIYHFTPSKSPGDKMAALGLKWQGQLSDYEKGARNYNAFMTIGIISELRKFDRMTKGIGSRQNEYDLLHSLLYRILTIRGLR